MIYKINSMFWDQNDSTGFRHISVEYNERCLMAITAHMHNSIWESKVIPMGFTFSKLEIEEFSKMFLDLPKIMDKLCSDKLTHEEITNFISSLQKEN